MKLLLDMNVSPRWTSCLNRAGIEAVHWSSVGRFDAPDGEILAFARVGGYVLLTQDLDFGAILAATGADAPSVVQLRSDNLDPDVIGDAVANAVLQLRPELAQGALLSIDPKRVRARVLPLRRPD